MQNNTHTQLVECITTDESTTCAKIWWCFVWVAQQLSAQFFRWITTFYDASHLISMILIMNALQKGRKVIYWMRQPKDACELSNVIDFYRRLWLRSFRLPCGIGNLHLINGNRSGNEKFSTDLFWKTANWWDNCGMTSFIPLVEDTGSMGLDDPSPSWNPSLGFLRNPFILLGTFDGRNFFQFAKGFFDLGRPIVRTYGFYVQKNSSLICFVRFPVREWLLSSEEILYSA